MNNFENNIDRMVSKILAEEIEKKSKQISEQLEEELSTGQKKIAKQAEPKDKITAADFKKLRDAKKHKEEVEEYYFYDKDESTPGDYEGDEEAEDEAEELSAQEPTYVGKGLADNKPGKIFGSFNDKHGWYDETDRDYKGKFDFDYDEEEFDDFSSLYDKYGKQTKWFSPGERGQKMFDLYKQKFGGPMKIRVVKSLGEEAETEEGNAFSGALAKAKESGKDSFEVDGRKYPVKEAKKEKKWIQKTDMKKGALHKKLNVPEDKKIPKSLLNKLKKELMAKGEGDKKLSKSDSTLLKQVNLAQTLKTVKENRNVLSLTENELIDMIENLVVEQQVKDKAEKNNISKKEATGLKKTEKILGKNKSEGDSYFKELAKKMTDYLKDGSKGKYEMNPESFPESNYQMNKDAKIMKYNPSEAVDEYIEAFSYPGMTNLVYDEIKPDDERIDKQLKGDSTFGNAVTDKDGKALGNVVPSKVGDRFKKNYDENLYGAEQMKASYKRQPQPVEIEGNGKTSGTLKSKKGADKPSSIAKASKILNTLESTENKAEKLVNEEMSKMKNLIGYNRKTQ